MLALKLTDIKTFMNTLLRTEVFDHFLLQEAVISSGCSFLIDGRITEDFYTKEECEELGLTECRMLPFSFLRTRCFDLIKGKKAPSAFRFVFLLSPENLRRTLASAKSAFTEKDISGVYINIRYQNGLLSLTTGISYTTFSMDRSLDGEWDKLVKRFLSRNSIEFEEM